MDPNEALQIIRTETALYRAMGAEQLDVDRLVEAVDALDEWLSDGGFLPKDWQR